MSKGFDIRAFRLRQAAQRDRHQKLYKGKEGGLGQFKEEDDFGVSMPTMSLERGEQLQIDHEQVIRDFNNEELIKKDEEISMQKRTQFSFGGQSVKDRIQKRKQNSKLGNEFQKLEKIIKTKKGEVDDESEHEVEEADESAVNKRQKTS